MAKEKKEVVDRDLKEEMGDDMPKPELWAREIETMSGQFEEYWNKCDKIVKRYKGMGYTDAEGEGSRAKRRYNVLWSIIQTMKPLVYSVPPKPHVSRRFNDNDPVARDASLIMERAQKYSLEGRELHDALLEARDDYLLCSRGVIWPRYTPYMRLRRVDVEDGHLKTLEPEIEIKTDESGRRYYEYEEKVYEEVDWEHVHYRDFLHGTAAKWKHVPWVARRVPMTRKELIDRFGKKMGKKPPLTINENPKSKTSASSDHVSDEDRGLFAKAEVWEIWDKQNRKVYWLCPKMSKEFLDVKDDFLELEGFFPCTRPAYSTKTNESLVPTPDFMLWQDIAIELDDVTHRIKLLTEALRVVGVYDASIGDTVKRVVTQTIDNDLIPVQGWAMFAERGGLKNSIEFLPVQEIAMTLERMYGARERLKQELYDITGLSDIVRGASDPRETATAQKVKGDFASKRLGAYQKEMERMIDEALDIEGEIMCKHYSDDTIKLTSSAAEVLTDQAGNFQPERFKAAMELIRSNNRQFRISIDERSLVEPGILEDMQQRGEIIGSLSQLLGQMPQFIEMTGPAGGPLMKRMLLFAMRAYPLARSEEASLNQAIDQLLASPPPPKEEEKKQGKSPEELQIEQQKVEISKQDLEMRKMIAQGDHQLRKMELDLKAQEMNAAFSNRNAETQFRFKKQEDDKLLGIAQIESQRQTAESQQSADMIKWMADHKEGQRKTDVDTAEKAREADMKAEVDLEKVKQQYYAAFQQAKAAKEKPKPSGD